MALPMTSGGYSPQQQQLFKPFQIGPNGPQSFKPRSGFGTFVLGEQEKYQRTPTQTPQGMDALQQLLQSGTQNIQNPYQGWGALEQRATNRFKSETIPGLAERFTQLGGSDTLGSSGLEGEKYGALSDFELGLQGLKQEYGFRNQQNALEQIKTGLTPQFETQHTGQGKGVLQKGVESIPKLIELLLKFL